MNTSRNNHLMYPSMVREPSRTRAAGDAGRDVRLAGPGPGVGLRPCQGLHVEDLVPRRIPDEWPGPGGGTSIVAPANRVHTPRVPTRLRSPTMHHDRPRWALLSTSLALAAILVAACAAPAPPSSPAPSAAPPSPSPSASPLAPSAPSDPTSPAPVPSATSTPPRATPTPTPAPPASRAERDLLGFLRSDARVDCVPRRTELPRGASIGVECRPDDPLVARVGIYGFGDEPDEAAVLSMYFDRLAEHGVSPASGDCQAGVPGDASWPDYLPDRDEDGVYRPTRAGCFIDQNGNANIRVLCYGPYYVGILGRRGDLDALDAWAWRVSEQQREDRDPPGICGAPD